MSENQFCYRVLLVDDLETARGRDSEFNRCGVQFETIEGVSAYMTKAFPKSTIHELPLERRFEHEWAAALLVISLAIASCLSRDD